MSGVDDTAPDPSALELAALVRAEVAPLRAELAAMREQLRLLTQPRVATDLDVDAVLAAIHGRAASALTTWTVREVIEEGLLPAVHNRRFGQVLGAACRDSAGLVGRWRVHRAATSRGGVVWRVERLSDVLSPVVTSARHRDASTIETTFTR